MAVTKCPNCGANVVDGGKFCAFCGSALPDDTQHIQIEHNINLRRERINRAKITREEKKAEVEKERLRRQVELKEAQAKLERERRETQKHDDKVLGFILLGCLGVILFVVLISKL